MAQPVVVTEVTAATGAGFGPVENHGVRSYNLEELGVKSWETWVAGQFDCST